MKWKVSDYGFNEIYSINSMYEEIAVFVLNNSLSRLEELSVADYCCIR